MKEALNSSIMELEESETLVENPPIEDPEGLDTEVQGWGDYPLDDFLIRHENRTLVDVLRRIDGGSYIMDPDFQRDFVWPEDKQSKLIESVIMRIPLPVFYLAEDREGRMIVVDGLQRLSTFHRFKHGELRLRLPNRAELNHLRFSDLPPKLMNRIEDCNLIFYIIDSKAPDRARLDIFERVNSGEPLSRQQMRNSLFMGPATSFLKEASHTKAFLEATRASLNTKTMRDRELINRFCAFRLLGLNEYRGDMDDFLAESLRMMNTMTPGDLSSLSDEFQLSMANNHMLFATHAFSKSYLNPQKKGTRRMLNASIWDVMSTGLSRYATEIVKKSAPDLRKSFRLLLQDPEFVTAITYSTNDSKRVRERFQHTEKMFREIFGARSD